MKFKVWNKISRRMFRVIEIVWGNTSGLDKADMVKVEDEGGNRRYLSFKNVVLLQHAEVRGENGILLDWWEGDLLTFNSDSVIWEVVRDDGAFWLKANRRAQQVLCRDAKHWKISKIGNIYEDSKHTEEEIK